MRFDSVLDTLQRINKRVFTTYDVAKLMGKPSAYASLVLSKTRRARRIERGKYFLEGADPYEIASNIIYPSYVSLQAGLQYYDLIDQSVIRYSVIAPKRHRTVEIGGLAVEFIKAKKGMLFGYVNRANAYVVSPEKLFVDCLYFGNVPFSTVREAFGEAVKRKIIDVGLLQKYAIAAKSKVLASKMGFLLELEGVDAEQLLPYKYYNYVDIHNTGLKGKNRKWRISYD